MSRTPRLYLGLRLGALALAGWAMPSATAAPACTFAGVTYCDGCTIDQPMTTTGGAACRIVSYSGGGFISSRTLVRPKHGIFARANRYDFAYQPNPGYVGEDYFEYEYVYRDKFGKSNRVVLRSKVTVLR